MYKSLKIAAVFLLWICLFGSAVQAASLPDFQTIVKENTPAVVKILVEYSAESDDQDNAHPNAPGIPENLRRFFEYRGGPPPQQQRPRQAMGSGFIISADGYIVTNNRVVVGADTVTVRLTDRREYEAHVVGLDERSDLALLQIEARDLPVLKLVSPANWRWVNGCWQSVHPLVWTIQ